MKCKKRVLFLLINLMLLAGLIQTETFNTYADNSNLTGIELSNDGKVVASIFNKTITVSGEGTIDYGRWMKLARIINPDAFKDRNTSGWVGTDKEYILEFKSPKVEGIKLCNPYETGGYPENVNGGLFEMFKGKIEFNDGEKNCVGLDENLVNASKMFAQTELANPDVSYWNTSNVKNMSEMFWGAKKMNPDVSNWDTSNVVRTDRMFAITNYADPDVSNWDTSNNKDMTSMFNAAYGVTSLDLSNFVFADRLTGFNMLLNVPYLESFEIGGTEHKFVNERKNYNVFIRDKSGHLEFLTSLAPDNEIIFQADKRYLVTTKKQEELKKVKIINGKLKNGGFIEAMYPEGMRVRILAESSDSGLPFFKWTGEDLEFKDKNALNTTFVVPNKDVTITANYKKPTPPTPPPPKDNNNDNNNNNNNNDNNNDNNNGDNHREKDSNTTVPDSNLPKNTIEKKPEIKKPEDKKPEDKKPEIKKPEIKFIDVKEEDWFHDSVYFVAEKGLMKGTSEFEFSPNLDTTRAMLITTLHRLSGDKNIELKKVFSDVEVNKWYTDAVNWGSKNEIVKGMGDNKFVPMGKLTREQFVTMLYRYSKIKRYNVANTVELNKYEDIKEVSDYALEPFKWAVSNGVITGTGEKTLSPKSKATRAQMAAIFERFTKLDLKNGEF